MIYNNSMSSSTKLSLLAKKCKAMQLNAVFPIWAVTKQALTHLPQPPGFSLGEVNLFCLNADIRCCHFGELWTVPPTDPVNVHMASLS